LTVRAQDYSLCSLLDRITAGATQFVPLKNISKVSGIKHFGPVKIEGDIVAQSIEASGDVDGVDVRSWPNDTLFKNGNCKNNIGATIVECNVKLFQETIKQLPDGNSSTS
jgi:hypothetical protein